MKTRISLLTLMIGGLLGGSALALTPASTKPAAKQSLPAAEATKARVKKPKPAPQPPAPPPLADASEDQLVAIERAYLGTYDCEFKQSVSITRNTKQGYLDVMWQKYTFTMKPVLSSTGALRLEDVAGRTLMIQIANKSMLLDTKIGQRLVDDCLHPEQRAAIERMRIARAAGGHHGADSALGIEPKAAVAATAVPAPVTSSASAPKS